MPSTPRPPSGPPPTDPAAVKTALRAGIRAARRKRSSGDRARDATRLAHALITATDPPGPAAGRLGTTVACYDATATEPDTGPTRRLLAASGVAVLLPVVDGDGPLRWRRDDAAAPSPADPTGLPAGEALAHVRLLLIPALAVDRAGHRLGQGGGHYDRTLRCVAPGTLVVAVVHDEELVADLPTERHDIGVDAALTPSGWIQLGDSAG